MLTSRDAILATDDLKRTTVYVEPWGDEVTIREMTVDENDAWQARWLEKENGGSPRLEGLRAHLCAISIVDGDGQRVFSDGDIEQLSKKSARAVSIVFDAAMKLNKLTQADVPEAIEKNSEPSPAASLNSR